MTNETCNYVIGKVASFCTVKTQILRKLSNLTCDLFNALGLIFSLHLKKKKKGGERGGEERRGRRGRGGRGERGGGGGGAKGGGENKRERKSTVYFLIQQLF